MRLTFTADEPGEIHLHGYDLTAVVSPDQPGELVFDATTAGAFAINFHVFAEEGMETGDSGGDSHHGPGVPDQVVSEMPISVSISAEPDARGGVDVHIATEGFRFAEELVDQAHTPGAGHAHIYVDGVKLGRVFEPQYHIPNLAPGEHEIRVSLNTNDHSELVYDGAKVESTITVSGTRTWDRKPEREMSTTVPTTRIAGTRGTTTAARSKSWRKFTLGIWRFIRSKLRQPQAAHKRGGCDARPP